MQSIVVVSGLPASGKTTLALALSSRLEFALLDKDTFLERLFADEGVGDDKRRRELSRRADALFEVAALGTNQAVLTSWWCHSKSAVDSGTPIAWLSNAGRSLVEVHCRCSAAVSLDRFRNRARHPGHRDNERLEGSFRQMLQEQESYGPLFPGDAIVVGTESPVDLGGLVEAVKSALRKQRVA